jgi:hypothetical protein
MDGLLTFLDLQMPRLHHLSPFWRLPLFLPVRGFTSISSCTYPSQGARVVDACGECSSIGCYLLYAQCTVSCQIYSSTQVSPSINAPGSYPHSAFLCLTIGLQLGWVRYPASTLIKYLSSIADSDNALSSSSQSLHCPLLRS